MKYIGKIFSKEFIDQRISAVKADKREDVFKLPPYRVEIQPTSYCNRSCSFCSHAIRNRVATELSDNIVSKLIESLKKCGCKNISFSGGGEPFLWVNGKLVEAVRATAKFAAVTLTTNGDGFWDGDELINKEMIELCSAIILNTPATDENTYSSLVKEKSNCNTNSEMIKKLIEFRNNINSKCRIYCVVVVNKNNIKELINIDKNLVKMNVDEIYYKMIKNYEGGRLDDLLVDQELMDYCRENLDSYSSIWLKQFLDYSKKEKPSQDKVTCCWSNAVGMNAIINPSGDVFVCTPTVGMKEYSIGNINENEFNIIWQSENRRQIVGKLDTKCRTNGCSDTCRYLGHNHAIENYIFEIEREPIVNAGADNIIQ